MTITKEILKKKIDLLPDHLIEKAYKVLENLKMDKHNKKSTRIKFKLGGQYDEVNVREKAYRKDSR